MSASHTQQGYIPTLKKGGGTDQAHVSANSFISRRQVYQTQQGLMVSYKVAEVFACFFETGSRVV